MATITRNRLSRLEATVRGSGGGFFITSYCDAEYASTVGVNPINTASEAQDAAVEAANDGTRRITCGHISEAAIEALEALAAPFQNTLVLVCHTDEQPYETLDPIS